MTRPSIRIAALAILALAAAEPATAQRRGTTQIGTLNCVIEPGVGLIVASQRGMSCRFVHSDGRVEGYVGRITKVGLDIGITGRAEIVWGVLAPSRQYSPGALAGRYAGVGADASVGVGGGARLLVGGSRRTISLQPLSVQGQVGANIAVGVNALELAAVR
jgi:hypothetical protein